MPRFSLAAGLGLVALTVLGCAALMTASTTWRQLTATVVILVLLLATAISIAWQQPSRWFWGGFAVSAGLVAGQSDALLARSIGTALPNIGQVVKDYFSEFKEEWAAQDSNL